LVDALTASSQRKGDIMRKSSLVVVAVLAAALAGCSTYTQTSSGQDWLAAYPPAAAHATGGSGDIDARVRAVAAVEPTLRFPARIGIARIGKQGYQPGLVPPSAAEAQIWGQLSAKLGPGFGSFVPISPLIAAMVEEPSAGPPATYAAYQARHLVDTIRLAAARQHLDAVLIYEVDATADAHSNALSIAEWTLIGALVLPSQDVKAVGVAQAMLIDVRNGYPYGQVTSTVDDKTQSVRFHTGDAEAALSAKVADAAVDKLADETEGMFRKLKTDLAALDTPHVRR
jgi:hypothetical protein